MKLWDHATVLLAQLEEVGKQAADGAGGDGAAPLEKAPPGLFGGFGTLLLPIMMVIVLYFLLVARPQKRQQAKSKEMLANLKKNDRIVTAGGIMGTVVNVREDTNSVTVRIDEATNTKLQILRSSIVRVLEDDENKKPDSK